MPTTIHKKLEDNLNQFMQISIANKKKIYASTRNLEIHVGQIAKKLTDKKEGTFTTITWTNP